MFVIEILKIGQSLIKRIQSDFQENQIIVQNKIHTLQYEFEHFEFSRNPRIDLDVYDHRLRQTIAYVGQTNHLAVKSIRYRRTIASSLVDAHFWPL